VDEDGIVKTFDPPLCREGQALAILRDDGTLFTDSRLAEARPLEELGLTVHLPIVPPADRLWSGGGVKRFLAGERPDPADVFQRVGAVVDRFIDFRRSLACQHLMRRLVACYVLATYFLDAFQVIGYLWPNGDIGTGKTSLLHTVCEQVYLGQVVLAGGTYASLRDLADYGATQLRSVHAFCPRLLSAIRLPDPVLASRSLTIPLVRSGDPGRAKASPLDTTAWPCDRRRLIDDLWATALAYLAKMPAYDRKAAGDAPLAGRDLEPWRALMAVARWLQDEGGQPELFAQVVGLARRYQEERTELEADDPTRLLIVALANLLATSRATVLEFETATLTSEVNRLANEAELTSDEDFTNTKRVGRLLERLRFERAPRTARRKRWKIGVQDLQVLAQTYGVPTGPTPENGTNGTLGNMAHRLVPSCHECRLCQEAGEGPNPTASSPALVRSSVDDSVGPAPSQTAANGRTQREVFEV
jgi:hypothetical protein